MNWSYYDIVEEQKENIVEEQTENESKTPTPIINKARFQVADALTQNINYPNNNNISKEP